jgi:pyruvate formate lyase activating enzyme
MSNTLFTATGCARCKITKKYMENQGIPFDELDIRAEGKDAFAQFYRTNRKEIVRGEHGVEFPIFSDGKATRQGLAVIVAYLQSGARLDGFVGPNERTKEWVDGLHISGGDSSFGDDFIALLCVLKNHGLKLQLTCNGKNALVLEKVFDQGLGDRVIMEVKGPANLYSRLLGESITAEEVTRSIRLTAKFPEYAFYTVLMPLELSGGSVRHMTPNEIGSTAQMIETATGNNKNPYTLRLFDPLRNHDERYKAVEPLAANELFQYRTRARRYQILTEIEKP